jgi:hypothetical protein
MVIKLIASAILDAPLSFWERGWGVREPITAFGHDWLDYK